MIESKCHCQAALSNFGHRFTGSVFLPTVRRRFLTRALEDRSSSLPPVASRIAMFNGSIGKVFRTPRFLRARSLSPFDLFCAFGIAFATAKAQLALKSKGCASEVMNALLQSSNVRYAVIQLSSTKGLPERLVLAYPNEETLRDLIAEPSIVGVGFSSRDEAVSAAGIALTTATASRQADGLGGSHAEEAQMHSLRERLPSRMAFLLLRRFATSIVQLGIAAAIFIFYSKNIVSATVRAVLAGSV